MTHHEAPNRPPERPLLLVSNDDGIDSFFLRALVDALHERYELVVVAPATEQSWIGRAVTRRGELSARRVEGWPCEAWAITGTPSDCVQIGLHHILGPSRRPHAVVSGMNLGMNITLNLTLGSGTVAAATEGAFAGLPAIAFSLAISADDFAGVSAARGRRDERGDQITRVAARRCLELTVDLLKGPVQPYQVHNINLPPAVSLESPVRRTQLARALMPSLYEELASEGDAKRLQFKFSRTWDYSHNPKDSDLRAISEGLISHCVLDWSRVSLDP